MGLKQGLRFMQRAGAIPPLILAAGFWLTMSWSAERAWSKPFYDISRIATTQYRTATTTRMLWGVSHDGHLAYRRDQVGGLWRDVTGTSGYPITDDGVSAASLAEPGTTLYETSAVGVSSDWGSLVEFEYWSVANDGTDSTQLWCLLDPPEGEVWLGPLQTLADKFATNNDPHFHVATAGSDGNLYVYDRDPTCHCMAGEFESCWSITNAGHPMNDPVDPTSVAGVNANIGANGTPSFFVRTTGGKLAHLIPGAMPQQWQWDTNMHASPMGLEPIGYPIAVANRNGVDDPHVHVFVLGDNDHLWHNTVSDNNVTWTWEDLGAPSSGSWENNPYAIAAVSYTAAAMDSLQTLDVYAVNITTTQNLLRRNVLDSMDAWSGWSSLGTPSDVKNLIAGTEAYPISSATGSTQTPHALVMGNIGQSNWGMMMYRDPTLNYYWNHGYPNNIERETGDNATRPHTESMLSERRGLVASASIKRPAPWRIYLDWSLDDGDTWNTETEIPAYNNAVPMGCTGTDADDCWPNPGDRAYRTDPIVAFDKDSDTAVVVVLEATMEECTGESDDHAGRIYYMTTTNGTTFSNKTQLDIENPYAWLDHQWLAIDYTNGAHAGRRHFIWVTGNFGGNDGYAFQDPGNALVISATGVEVGSAPQIFIDASGQAFATSSWGNPKLCAITCDNANPPNCSCNGGVITMNGKTGINIDPTNVRFVDSGNTVQHVRATQGWAFWASPTIAGRLYYVWQAAETGGGCAQFPAGVNYTRKDIYFSVSTDSGANWSMPISPAGVTNDCDDQFMPTVTAVARRTDGMSLDETVIVSYYDRSYHYQNHADHFIQPMYAVSSNAGVSFSSPREDNPDSLPTDPEQLPWHCSAEIYFLGDYHHTNGGGNTHAHTLYSEAPYENPLQSNLGNLENSSLSSMCF